MLHSNAASRNPNSFCIVRSRRTFVTRRRLLCFGDSNTYGWQAALSGPTLRYPANVRWTGRLAALLGRDWEVAGRRSRRQNVAGQSNRRQRGVRARRGTQRAGLPSRLSAFSSAAGHRRHHARQQRHEIRASALGTGHCRRHGGARGRDKTFPLERTSGLSSSAGARHVPSAHRRAQNAACRSPLR